MLGPSGLHFRRCLLAMKLTKSACLRQPRQAAFIIAEQIAQHRAGVLTDRGRSHWIDDRRTRIADRQRHIGYPTYLRMRDTGHESTFPCLRRANGFTDAAHLPARHARRANPLLPIRPGLLRESSSNDRKELIPWRIR